MIKLHYSAALTASALLLLITACAPTPRKVEQVLPPIVEKVQNTEQQNFEIWLEELRQEALAQGIRPEVLQEALDGLQPIPAVVTPRQKQAEFSLTKLEYVRRLASDQRLHEGLRQIAQHRVLLQKVSETYGVQPEYLVALWAIESDFGKGGRRHAVIGALATQAYQGERQAFFRKQLLAALTILDQEQMRSEDLRGSWAGAMGHFQFIPTTYRDYAVDFNGDGHRNIWTDVEDAVASAASYLARAGWTKDQKWGWLVVLPEGFDRSLADSKIKKTLRDWRELGIPVSGGADDLNASLILPDGPDGQAFLVTGNFRTLMRWNRSTSFALAVGTLADRLKKEADALITAEDQLSKTH
ncbi:MAG: lytic transglycosylase domain-containing protein [Pedobacter sp.]